MAFDITKEKRSLDRFYTWWNLKFNSGCPDCTTTDCGCHEVAGMFAIESRIYDTYLRFMSTYVTSKSKRSAARQAFWANIKFCENFNEYFHFDWDTFSNDAQYYTWRFYCENELGFKCSDSDRWEPNEFGEFDLVWEKPFPGVLFKYSQKYRTWKDQEIEMVTAEELGL